MKMIKIQLIVGIAMLSLIIPQSAKSGPVIFKAKMDSATLLMGKQTTIHLEIAQDKEAVGYMSSDKQDTLTANVEVAERPKADTIDLDNNRIQINKDLIIQSFDSGVYVIPGIKYVVGKDTFSTKDLTLKVMPVKVDSLTTVHDYKGVEAPPYHFFDWLPTFVTDYWWIYVIVLALIAIGIYVYFKWIKQGKMPLKPRAKEVPPYEEAMQRLEALKSQHLWQNGQEKEYFTELTDILRRYIDRRFGINAMEMTSNQIIAILKKNEETNAVNNQLQQILEMADFVKFAKMRPLPEDNEATYQRALNFVEATKPIEKPQEETEGDRMETAAQEKKERNNNGKVE